MAQRETTFATRICITLGLRCSGGCRFSLFKVHHRGPREPLLPPLVEFQIMRSVILVLWCDSSSDTSSSDAPALNF
jgi:hypothetical protein